LRLRRGASSSLATNFGAARASIHDSLNRL
jgi:hypothetical protein